MMILVLCAAPVLGALTCWRNQPMAFKLAGRLGWMAFGAWIAMTGIGMGLFEINQALYEAMLDIMVCGAGALAYVAMTWFIGAALFDLISNWRNARALRARAAQNPG